MAQTIEQLFSELGIWAIPASLLLNGILNMVGFIPSVFVTTANVLIWGPLFGGILSWLGEIGGSVLAFILYRKGIQVGKIQRHMEWKWIQWVNKLPPFRQWLAMVAIRMNPFIPSGAIHLVGSLTTISFFTFLYSTMIGKIPSIALEVWIGYGFIHINEYAIQLTLTLLSIGLVFLILKKNKQLVKEKIEKNR